MIERMGAENEAVCLITDVAEGERVDEIDGIDVRSRGLVGSEGVVVAVDDGDGAWPENRVHGPGLGGGETDGKKALPIAAGESAARSKLIEDSGGQVDELEDRALIDDGRVQRGGVGDEGDDGGFFRAGFDGAASGFG